MKKVISVVLVLLILISPIGVVSKVGACNTQKNSKIEIIRCMRAQRLSKVRIIATLLIDGTMSVSLAYFDEYGRFLNFTNANYEVYEFLKKEFSKMKVLYKLKILNLDIVQVIYEIDNEGDLSVNIYYLDFVGRIKYTE